MPAERALAENPYHPFQNSADFSFASFAVNARLSKPEITTLLSAQTSNAWSEGPTKLSYRRVTDVFSNLSQAADTFEKAGLFVFLHKLILIKFAIQFETAKVSVPYGTNGEIRPITFKYKPILPWIHELAQDHSLADVICWDAVQRYICDGSSEKRLISEPNSAHRWWDAQVRICQSYFVLLETIRWSTDQIMYLSRLMSRLLCHAIRFDDRPSLLLSNSSPTRRLSLGAQASGP